MPGLLVVPVGLIPGGLTECLADFLAGTLGRSCRVSGVVVDPSDAWMPERRQYNARVLLERLEQFAGGAGPERVLGVADIDLCSPVFTFVFGEARLGGPAGVCSIHRLRPSLYGLRDDAELLAGRARREALHEAGHLFGLAHCRLPGCVMRFSGAVEEVDLKPESFCPACEAELGAAS